MKISSFIYFILITGGVFFIFASIVDESNQQFPNNQVNNSQWKSTYDYVDQINLSFSPVQNAIINIADENQGFFSKLGAGIIAIPYAILIFFPTMIFQSLIFGEMITIGFFGVLGLPQKLISLAMTMLIAFGIFKFFEAWNKTPI